MRTTTIRADQLEHVLTTVQDRSLKLISIYRSQWRSAEDRESARQALAGSVSDARGAIERLQGTSVPELQQLVSKLIVHSELADGTLKDPTTLQR
jgi:hypothetical protein